ncbi:ribosomal RNA processing protein 36 [Carex littledalei]|uniref:rRNA biogenesis protein RRP36 n=1 Tax=Carex littledalei TaxID=544730 RepID=A0A833V4I4_9POAL|nr:ribosomal RNA processing protein 36 [Carex littledalei]
MGNHKRFLEEGKEEDDEEDSESTSSLNDEGSESESESVSGDELEIERELADVPFEELQRARADGSHLSGPLKHKQSAIQKKPSRANKNRPMEVSSKIRPKKFREVVQVPKKMVRDPRFESLCGTLDTEGFRKRYNFLYDVQLPSERQMLQKMITKSKNPDVISELKSHISWIDKQVKSDHNKATESKILSEHIRKEKEAAKQGKKPYYLKKSEIRNRKLVGKYNELKDTGKLDAFIEKRRKKNASKDQRYMPYRRPGESSGTKE